jgi:hypothetical protein
MARFREFMKQLPKRNRFAISRRMTGTSFVRPVPTGVRRRFLCLLLTASAASLRADLPPLLETALVNALRDRERWAYTETKVERDDKGQVKGSSIVRFDPSKPYPQQYTPISINGTAPTEHDFRKYRELGEKRAPKAEKAAEVAAKNEQRLSDMIDPNGIRVKSEDPVSVTFDLGLRKTFEFRFPPKSFQVLVRVDKAKQTLQHVDVQLEEPFRYLLVLKASSGAFHADFATPDPRYGTVRTTTHFDGAGTLLFVHLAVNEDLTRADFKHVRPVDESFDVKIGPLKALDF